MKLEEIAKKMCAKGKGILAADESTGTIAKRFKSINVENTEKNRLVFRQTLFSSEAMKNYIGGVILFDETIKQKTTLGLSVPELISKNNAIPGIKVDKGAKPLAGSPDETVTEGLDGLRERLKEYYELGARFTKWRAVYKIGNKFPSSQSIKSNAHALARYAALVQEAKMVPIIEPEVLMEGNHSADVCYKNENTGQVYVEDPDDLWIKNSNINVQKHEYSLTEYILIFLDDNKSNEENDECKDKWWTSFEEDKRVIIKVADIWQGMTAHYSTAYAISPEDIMINGKWICS